ncbi:MAG: polysaccharide biosynthesis protein [bacterium]|nr:polysaccharide biosynthesis protein [bacterium]
MKEKFIKSTLILLVGGFFTKLLGMIIKIVMSRMIGTEGLGLYMLILPTFSLFIGLSQFGMPIALSKLIAEDKKNNKRLFFSILSVVLMINLILMLVIILFAPVLANKLLHNADTYYGIIAIALVIPFTSISSICRSYFFGKEKMLPHVISNLLEDVVRLILMVVGIPFFEDKGLNYAVCYIILSNIISEGISILVLFFFLPRKVVIKKEDLIPSKIYILESLSIGIPNTTGRLVGSLGYFLEPIILTLVLLHCGYSQSFITREYGILSGYVMPLVLLPSFFTNAISQALLPIVAREYVNKRYDNVKRKLKQAITISLIIGIPVMIFFVLFPSFFLKVIYHTTAGKLYVQMLAPICLFQYIQAPLSSALEAMGKSRDVMFGAILGMVIRTGGLFIFSFFKIGIWGLILAIALNVLAVAFYDIYKVNKYL